METNLAAVWPKEGPPVVWKKRIGEGWSGPVVASNRTILFYREDGQEIVQCVSATNGALMWKVEYPTTYKDDFGFDEGPRSTPAIDGTRVFTFGANGILNAWNFQDGTNLWRIDTRERFGSGKGWFGIACSALVEGNVVILNVGGNDGAGIVGFEKSTGKILWKATTQEASYSSPVSATISGLRRTFVLGRSALVALDPTSGKVDWEYPFRPGIDASVTAATPLIIGDCIFISASYGAGAAFLRFGKTSPEVIWNEDGVLSSHYATSVEHSGFLFGFDGRQEQRCNLRCVELKSGKVRWSEDHFGAGQLIGAGDKLLILSERGELFMAPALPDKFAPMARAQVLGSDCRAAPALANGFFYARDKAMLVCVRVGK